MASAQRKREHKRYGCENDAYLYRYHDQEKHFDAKVSNYSQGGLFIETRETMNAKQRVFIRMKKTNYYGSGPEKYQYYVGYIKWRDSLGPTSSEKYGYGVQYEYPVQF